ncbi:MAG: class I SAM-dependent methyltransferase [Planctomycetota bacterium]|nr:class I SAM-dependent methyltransferase [Planctomycetota bacterium]
MSHFDEAAATWDQEPARVRRMREVGQAIVREAAPTREMTVLDYGSGTGLVGLYLLPHVHSVVGADNSPGMLEVLRKKIAEGHLHAMRAVRLDLQVDPVPDDRYHMVVISMALHHIADVDRTLRGCHQMLRPGGILCVADLDSEPGTFHPTAVAGSVHHLGFDRKELKGRLESIGFIDARDATVSTFSKPVEKDGEQTFLIFLVTARRRV